MLSLCPQYVTSYNSNRSSLLNRATSIIIIIVVTESNCFRRFYLPLLFEFLATVAVALAIRGEPFRLLPGTPGSPDAIYVRIFVPFATGLMFNPNLCLCAVIWAFALEAITLCRCVRLLWLFRIRAWPGTGTARGAGVTALAAGQCVHYTSYAWTIIYRRSISKRIGSKTILFILAGAIVDGRKERRNFLPRTQSCR